jgi:hypothetical protein
MEVYIGKVLKARALDSDVCRQVLQRHYPTAWDFTPVSLLVEASSFYLLNEPDIIQDVFEVDDELGKRFDTLMIDVLIPGQPRRVANISTPSRRVESNYKILDEANLWINGQYRRWHYKDELVMDWGCEHLFTKRRKDGTTRRHAPPHVGGRLLHELKYPKLIQCRGQGIPILEVSELASYFAMDREAPTARKELVKKA